jgi:hypothetical protein
MRLLFEIIFAAAVIALAWEKPLSERAGEIPWIGSKIAPGTKASSPSQPSRSQSRSIATPATTASGSWMWDPNHKTPLDPPKKHAEPTPH